MSTQITIQGLPDLAPIRPQPAEAPQTGGFEGVLEQVSEVVQKADQLAAGYAQGKVGLTEAVLAANNADTSFQLLMSVRNRALAAYQEISSLQV